MNFSRREVTLALATGLVLLIGLTYWIVSNKLPAIQEGQRARVLMERQIAANQRDIRKQKPLMAELNGIIGTLPQHGREKDVKYALLQEISQQAGNTQFNLIRRVPGEERKVGNTELYELSIACTYESTIEPLVYFLYNLQARGAVMNVSELQVKQASSRPDRKGQLKGDFVVDFAYSRVDNPAPEAPPAPATPPATAAAPPAPAMQTTPTSGPPAPGVANPPALPAPGPAVPTVVPPATPPSPGGPRLPPAPRVVPPAPGQ